jgi:hypothetical protein
MNGSFTNQTHVNRVQLQLTECTVGLGQAVKDPTNLMADLVDSWVAYGLNETVYLQLWGNFGPCSCSTLPWSGTKVRHTLSLTATG